MNLLNVIKYLHPAKHQPVKMREVAKLYGDKLDFKGIKLSVKIQENHKIKRKTCINISVLVMKMRRNIQCLCPKNVVKINILIYN